MLLSLIFFIFVFISYIYFYRLMELKFRSGISVILILIVLGILLLTSYDRLILLIDKPNSENIVHFIIFSLIITPVFFICFGIRYIVTDDKIIFKIGFIESGSVKISDIVLIKRTYNPLSSNAASLKRLYCKLKKGSYFSFLLISPKNEDLFLKLIKEKNPNVEINVKNKKGFFRILNWDI